MKLTLSRVFFIVLASTFFYSCNNGSKLQGCVDQPDIEEIRLNVDYTSLTQELFSINTPEGLRSFSDKHPALANVFLKKHEYPSEAVYLEETLKLITNPYLDSLRMEVERVFSDEEELKEEFETAFRHLKYYYPEVKIPKIKTVTSGFGQDMYISDSLIIIGLDYYLGNSAKYRPTNMYTYMLDRYSPDYIVPSVMLIYGISPRFNKTSLGDKTVLADMITYGKAFYFAKHMMPCTPDSVMIWYSGKEIQGAHNNLDIIWAHFVENNIIYETSHEVKRKYIEERPKTYEIGNEAPGRIGTWLGWQVVRAYMDRNEEVTLPELMNTESPQKIFNESKFRP